MTTSRKHFNESSYLSEFLIKKYTGGHLQYHVTKFGYFVKSRDENIFANDTHTQYKTHKNNLSNQNND